MPLTVIPRVLREKWEGDVIDGLIELFNQSEQKTKEDVIALSGEKFERRLSEEIGKVKIEIEGVRSDIKIMEGLFKQKLSEEITLVRADFKEEIASIRADFKEKIASVKADLKVMEEKIERRLSDFKTDIVSFKAEIIKWMFLFWVGQLVCVAGLIKWLR